MPAACRGFVLAWMSAIAATIASPTDAASTRLEREARAILAQHFEPDGPGAAVALVRGRKVLVATAFGLADIDAGRPIDTRTTFDLASVSKQFTATATLLLAQDGELELDAPLARYVPEFSVKPRGRAVTIADLLHHVSGLDDYTGDSWDEGDEAFARLTPESHLTWINRHRALRAPGKKYEYNNSGYVLLALAIERVSGASYAEFLARRVLRPAAMRDTAVLDRLDLAIPRAARGYTTAEGKPEVSVLPTQITGDGNIFASLDDMVAWTRALAHDAVLTAESKHRLWTNGELDDGSPIDDDGFGYGLGWVLDERGNALHSGSWSGTATFIAHDRQADLWIIVLSNDEEADVEDIAKALWRLEHDREAD
jgi:CubicO group peptidase (beta-lactamase class C family)